MAKLVAEVAAGRQATSEHRTLNELLDEPDPLCEGVPATDVEPTEEASADFSAGQTGPFIGSAAASHPDATTALRPARLPDRRHRPVRQHHGTIAFRATIEDGPIPVSFDQITAQAGNVVILLTYVTVLGDQSDPVVAERLLQTMVDRVG